MLCGKIPTHPLMQKPNVDFLSHHLVWRVFLSKIFSKKAIVSGFREEARKRCLQVSPVQVLPPTVSQRWEQNQMKAAQAVGALISRYSFTKYQPAQPSAGSTQPSPQPRRLYTAVCHETSHPHYNRLHPQPFQRPKPGSLTPYSFFGLVTGWVHQQAVDAKSNKCNQCSFISKWGLQGVWQIKDVDVQQRCSRLVFIGKARQNVLNVLSSPLSLSWMLWKTVRRS